MGFRSRCRSIPAFGCVEGARSNDLPAKSKRNKDCFLTYRKQGTLMHVIHCHTMSYIPELLVTECYCTNSGMFSPTTAALCALRTVRSRTSRVRGPACEVRPKPSQARALCSSEVSRKPPLPSTVTTPSRSEDGKGGERWQANTRMERI